MYCQITFLNFLNGAKESGLQYFLKKCWYTVDQWPSSIILRKETLSRVSPSNETTVGKEEMSGRNKSICWILESLPNIFSSAKTFLAQEGKPGIQVVVVFLFFGPFSTSDSPWPEQVAASLA